MPKKGEASVTGSLQAPPDTRPNRNHSPSHTIPHPFYLFYIPTTKNTETTEKQSRIPETIKNLSYNSQKQQKTLQKPEKSSCVHATTGAPWAPQLGRAGKPGPPRNEGFPPLVSWQRDLLRSPSYTFDLRVLTYPSHSERHHSPPQYSFDLITTPSGHGLPGDAGVNTDVKTYFTCS